MYISAAFISLALAGFSQEVAAQSEGGWDNAPVNATGKVIMRGYDVSKPPSHKTSPWSWNVRVSAAYPSENGTTPAAEVTLLDDAKTSGNAIDGWNLCPTILYISKKSNGNRVPADCKGIVSDSCMERLRNFEAFQPSGTCLTTPGANLLEDCEVDLGQSGFYDAEAIRATNSRTLFGMTHIDIKTGALRRTKRRLRKFTFPLLVGVSMIQRVKATFTSERNMFALLLSLFEPLSITVCLPVEC